jgi:L-ascorbate metabolism protein UlaG (beta-lactamase superfamily)
MKMKLIYIYHSCYAIEGDDYTILIDFYKDQSDVKGRKIVQDILLNRSGAFYVLSTHGHSDHFTPEVLSWKINRPDIHYIFSKDILVDDKASATDAVYLNKGETYQDDLLRIEAFGSTDLGVSFYIEVGGKRIFHAGDLNNWHWNEESTPQESAEYEDFYLKELSYLAKNVPLIDMAMFPVDPRLGKDYMRGAEQLIDYISVKNFAPMHFGIKYDKANAFAAYARMKDVRFVMITKPGESFEF